MATEPRGVTPPTNEVTHSAELISCTGRLRRGRTECGSWCPLHRRGARRAPARGAIVVSELEARLENWRAVQAWLAWQQRQAGQAIRALKAEFAAAATRRPSPATPDWSWIRSGRGRVRRRCGSTSATAPNTRRSWHGIRFRNRSARDPGGDPATADQIANRKRLGAPAATHRPSTATAAAAGRRRPGERLRNRRSDQEAPTWPLNATTPVEFEPRSRRTHQAPPVSTQPQIPLDLNFSSGSSVTFRAALVAAPEGLDHCNRGESDFDEHCLTTNRYPAGRDRDRSG